jgi:hypothetical protein
MRPPVSGDHYIYHITVSHIPLSRGYLIRFNILFKPVGQVATIIVQTELNGLNTAPSQDQ